MTAPGRFPKTAPPLRRAATAAASLVAAGGALSLVRPRDRGAPHTGLFERLNVELRDRGPGKPVLLVDLDALDANIDVVRRAVAPGLAVRVVAKSLPSIPMLRYVMERLGTNRVMVFDESLAFLCNALPEADVLLGKPLPVQAAAAFYEAARKATTSGGNQGGSSDSRSSGDSEGGSDSTNGRSGGDPGQRVRWLVDKLDRLRQYVTLARSLGVRMRVSIEVDVGLHRGGLSDPAELRPLLDLIAAEPEHLSFAGLMGYDAHVTSAPPLLSSRDRAFHEAVARYSAFKEAVQSHAAGRLSPDVVLNGGGSKTYMLHTSNGPVTEVALGSCLVKPTDFDVETLAAHAPALFIATPVLKRLQGTKVPYLEWASRAWSLWDPNREVTYFVFGGGWMAKPVSPAGLSDNPIYGFSTNQAMLNGSERTALSPDDWIFFRPTQSERVMQHFGSLHLVRNAKLTGTWDTIPLGL